MSKSPGKARGSVRGGRCAENLTESPVGPTLDPGHLDQQYDG